MKRKYLACVIVVCLLMPCLLLSYLYRQDEPLASTDPTVPELSQNKQYVTVLMNEESVQMELEDYIVGVVLGEMPADFETEALKAQAVVARTFTLKRKHSSKHPQADICTDAACCQAYMQPEEYLRQGGIATDLKRFQQAAVDTAGEVLVFDGKLIEATYFSCSGGRTEDALAVWGSDVPYLQATDSPGEENAAHFTDTVSFSAEEFCHLLEIEWPGFSPDWIGEIVYTDGGGVKTIMIKGVPFKGTTLRQKLGLRSTAFIISAVGDTITITTKGFGHRVGMSQYGADAMAVQGKKYDEILYHYYHGTQLIQIAALQTD